MSRRMRNYLNVTLVPYYYVIFTYLHSPANDVFIAHLFLFETCPSPTRLVRKYLFHLPAVNNRKMHNEQKGSR